MKFGIVDASLQVAFIVMKLCGAVSWSWWLVMLPILLVVVMNIFARLLVLLAKTRWSRQLIKQGDTDNLLVFFMKTILQEEEEIEKKRKQQSNIEQQ